MTLPDNSSNDDIDDEYEGMLLPDDDINTETYMSESSWDPGESFGIFFQIRIFKTSNNWQCRYKYPAYVQKIIASHFGIYFNANVVYACLFSFILIRQVSFHLQDIPGRSVWRTVTTKILDLGTKIFRNI